MSDESQNDKNQPVQISQLDETKSLNSTSLHGFTSQKPNAREQLNT